MRRGPIQYFNDQCLKVLRNWPYPIRRKVKYFRPIASRDKKSVVAVLCRPRQFLEGLWSLWAWMRHLNPYLKAVLLVDGSATVPQRALFKKLFPNGELLEVGEFLNQRPLPDYLRRFVAGHWVAKKMAAVFELQKEMDVLYSDCDVVAFKAPTEMIERIARGQPFYFREEAKNPLDPWFCGRAEQIGMSANPLFNAGLTYVPRGTIKESLLESMLGDWQPAFNHHLAEQTLFSLLLDSENVRPLPPDRYIISNQGYRFWDRDLDCSRIVSRHYTGPTRHRMYSSAYPYLVKQMDSGII